ncbi:MAG TPA: DUF2059 domain-containing protein [Methylomirabilota bacterium]|nr:DUF2059 domain-containing protein [Methylomirabilota bacterium]
MKAVLALVILYVGTFLVALAGYSKAQPQEKQDPAAPVQPAPSSSSVDPAKEGDIRALLELSGTGDILTDLAPKSGAQFTQRIENLMPDKDRAQKLSVAFTDRYKAHFDTDEMTRVIVRLYDKHFTADEIKQLLKFYGSPLGQKFAAEMPKLTQEAQTAGIGLSQQAARDAWQDLRQQNPDLAQAQRQEWRRQKQQ